MDKYVVFHIDGGAGKSVMATAVCASIKKAYPEHKLVVVTAWPEVFLHNPNVYRVYKVGNFAYFYDDFIKNKETVILRNEPYFCEDFIHRKKHLVEVWCDLYKIPSITVKPQLFLTQRELIHAARVLNKQGGQILLMQTNGGGNDNEPYSWARDISTGFSQRMVDEFKPQFEKILHIRKEKQPALNNTVQVTDTLRNLFCYVYLSDKLILIDSLIQHVAAAFDKKAAVAWISNSPTVFGYQTHENITPSQDKVFRHSIDSYLDESDWTGTRHFECPYNDIDNIFSIDPFKKYINSSNQLDFKNMPKGLK